MLKRNRIDTIISRKGAGKSVLMQYLILTNPRSCIIFDPTMSLQNFKNRIFFNYERWGAIGFKKLLNHIGTRLYSQKIDIVINNCLEPEEILQILYYSPKVQGIGIVMDEIDLYYSAQMSQRSVLYAILNIGRHKSFDFVGVCRRPANCPRALTSQSDYIYLGIHNQEPNDLKYLQTFINQKALLCYNSLNLYDFLKVDLTNQKSKVFKLPNEALKILNVEA
jgi:hypothetical protein